MITYGIVSLESQALKDINSNFHHEISEHIDTKFTIDDISQYSPIASALVLDAFKIKSKHNISDKLLILTTSTLVMASTVTTIKSVTPIWRPDSSSKNTFPSGHTATAFMGAEFLMQEFKDESVWIGVAG